MTNEELEKKLGELRWKKAPATLDERVLRQARARARGKIRPWPFAITGAAAAALFCVYFFWPVSSEAPAAPRVRPPDPIAVKKEVLRPEFEKDPTLWGIVTDVRGRTKLAAEARIKCPAALETGDDGLVAVLLRDGSLLKLNTNTRLGIDATMWKWNLAQGEIWCDANPKAERPKIDITTPAGDARILGTEFNIQAGAIRMILSVRRGEVELSNARGKVSVGSSRQAQSTRESAPRVVRLVNDDRVFGWARQLKGVKRHALEKSIVDEEPIQDGAAGTLEAEGAPLTLRDYQVRISIEDDIATTEVEQVFFNNTGRRMEGVFRFPLPKDASISRFAMTVTDHKLMEGRIVEKHRARQIYESILRRREDPGLLEWQEGNQFSARIFPIEPNSDKRIVIAYTQTLPRRDGRVQFVMPLVSEALASNPPKSVKFSLRLKCRGSIESFECPSHHLNIQKKDASEYLAQAEASDYTPLNDLVLNYQVQSDEVTALRQGEYVMVRVRPDFKGRSTASSGPTVYWLDASHSTTPSLREIQYNLLARMLSTLHDSDTFTIFTGDVTGRYLLEKPLPATAQNREIALAKVWGMETGGATDLAASLEDLNVGLPENSTLVYIGDGVATLGVRDTVQLGRLFAEGVGKKLSRFFAFAMGNSINELLLETWALQKSGVLFRLTPGDQLSRRVREFSWAMKRPVLRDIQASIEGAEEVYPRKFTGLVRGEDLVLLARKASGKVLVKVSGHDGQERIEMVRALDLGNLTESTALARLWAQRKVKDLLATDVGGANKNEIIALSEQYTIMTPYTSLLVLETEEEFKRYNIPESPKAPAISTGLEGKSNRAPAKKEIDGLADPVIYKSAEEPRVEAVPPSASPSPAPAPVPGPMPGFDDRQREHVESPSDEDFNKAKGDSEGWAGDGPLRRKSGKSLDQLRNDGRDFYASNDRSKRTAYLGSLVQTVETTQDGRLQAEALNALQQLLISPSHLNVERSAIVEGLQTLLRYRPMLREHWIVLGRLYREMKEDALALRTVTTIVEIAPDDPFTRQSLSSIFLEFGALRQARFEISEVTRLRPEEPEPYFQLGELLVREGNFKEAEECFRRMLRFNFHERFGSIDARARDGLLSVYRAMIDRKIGNRSELEDKIRRLQAGQLEFKDIKVVLSWKTGGTDVDLWVTAPGEEKCTYQQKSTFRGGRLDRDVTSGFGPETYTLPEFRDGAWLIEVEFFSGGAVTAGQVDIILFEGTEREVKKTVPFTLKESKHKVTIFKGELKDLLEH